MTDKRRNLAADLVPRKLSELVGQDRLVSQLRNGMKDRIPLAILLSGETGVGKSTIAKIIARSVQCDHGEFGEPCEECLSPDSDFLFNIIERNCADLGNIDDMRALLPGLSNYPSYGKYRVIILDEAHGMGPKAQEVLLLPTLDTSSRNLFILCTTNPTKILDTLKRRCVSYMVPGLSRDGVASLVESTLHQAGSNREPSPLVSSLMDSRINSAGVIISAVEKYIAGSTPEEAIIVKDVSSINHYELAKNTGMGKWDVCQRILGQAVPSDADVIKRQLSAYFRKIMLDPGSSPVRLKFCAEAIHELSANNAATVYEQGFQLSILTASIWKICMMSQEATANAKKGLTT